MNKEIQAKLKNYSVDNRLQTTSSELICGLDFEGIFDLTTGLVLPPDYAYRKYDSEDYLRFYIYHILKGNKTIKKTYKYLIANPNDLEKIGIKKLPAYFTIVQFKSMRLGNKIYFELKSAINEYIHNNGIFVRDNISAYKEKRNTVKIYSGKAKAIAKQVFDILLEMVQNNEVVNNSYSNRDILGFIMDTVTDERGSLYSYTSLRRNDYTSYQRGKIPTSKTMFNRIREMFVSDEAFDRFVFKATQKIINLLRKFIPRQFNRIKFDIAIDDIGIPTWESISKSPNPTSILLDSHVPQKGTNKFREYDVVSIVFSHFKFVLGYIPLYDTDRKNKEVLVEKLILRAKSLVPIRYLLMDKEYETKQIIQLLKSMKISYLTPTKRTEGVMAIANKMNDSFMVCDRVIDGTVVSKMFILKEYKGQLEHKIIPFTTNIPVNKENAHQLAELYKTRWNIETNFRDLKIFKVLTTSRDTHIRNFFFGTATMMINLWVLANIIAFYLYMRQMPKKPVISKIAFKKYSSIQAIDSS